MVDFIQNIITNDYFIMLALIITVFALVKVWKYVRVRFDISSEDIDFVINGVRVGDSLLRKMGILDKEKSKEITRLVVDALAFVQTIDDADDKEKVRIALAYFKELAMELNVEIDVEDELIVKLTFEKILLK